jgi:hypothetical protein
MSSFDNKFKDYERNISLGFKKMSENRKSLDIEMKQIDRLISNNISMINSEINVVERNYKNIEQLIKGSK